MIIPPTKLFFVINTSGDAAEFLISKLSPTTTCDIREATMYSGEYPEDIQASNEMDVLLSSLKADLSENIARPLFTTTQLNPLFIPTTRESIDEVLEGEPESEHFRFNGMDSSPFTIKMIDISQGGEDEIIHAKIACHEFQLPSYRDILEAQKLVRLN
jgi:hypothetical protein